MNKEDKYSLGYAIGKTIQENKDKIEKLEQQNIRFKKKNKQLKTQLDIANKKLEEIDTFIRGHQLFGMRFAKTLYRECLEHILSIIGGE